MRDLELVSPRGTSKLAQELKEVEGGGEEEAAAEEEEGRRRKRRRGGGGGSKAGRGVFNFMTTVTQVTHATRPGGGRVGRSDVFRRFVFVFDRVVFVARD